MATTLVSPPPKLRFVDTASGVALSGGKLFTYAGGTTTKQNTFTDQTGATPNANPIILDSRGECNCWLTPSLLYKFTLSPSTDTDPPTSAIWTVDNVSGPISSASLIAMTGAAINEASVTLASASTVNIGAALGNYIFISGNTTITAFDTVQSGTERTLEFQGALTLTASSSIITPNGLNITTVAGMVLKLRSEGAGNWRIVGDICAGQIQGTATNDNASAGNIGQFISSTVLAGAAVSITSATAADITSISLTAGDWDVWGTFAENPAGATTTSSVEAWISTTSATIPIIPNGGAILFIPISLAAGNGILLPIGITRLSLSTTTTVFLSCQVSFAVSTNAAYGFIGARRVR